MMIRPLRRASMLLLFFAAELGLPALSRGQNAVATAPTPQTIEVALQQMADIAGVIFAGEVTAIRQRTGENGASGVVEIDFRVDEAIRGCTSGALYTLREWAGLWAGGDQRYRVGQRLLLLLHAPGAAGISSPVGGMAGVIPIRGTSSAPQAASASTTGTSQVADLRWVGTRLERVVPYAASPVVTAADQATGTADASASDTSTASQQAPVEVVVNMLRSWQQGRP